MPRKPQKPCQALIMWIERVRAAWKECPLQASTIAKRTEGSVDQSTVWRILEGDLAGYIPSAQSLVAVSTAIGLTADGYPATISTTPTGGIRIPMAGRAAADTSGGTRVEFDHEGEALELPDRLGLVEIRGDSLGDIILDGQHVIIDLREGSEPHDGDLVVAQTAEGATYAKRWFCHDNMVELQSANPMKPQPSIILHRRNIARVNVIRGAWYG